MVTAFQNAVEALVVVSTVTPQDIRSGSGNYVEARPKAVEAVVTDIGRRRIRHVVGVVRRRGRIDARSTVTVLIRTGHVAARSALVVPRSDRPKGLLALHRGDAERFLQTECQDGLGEDFRGPSARRQYSGDPGDGTRRRSDGSSRSAACGATDDGADPGCGRDPSGVPCLRGASRAADESRPDRQLLTVDQAQ